ncbi:MAG: beta-propeller domain-containing protein [Deltaproteobacteria bacterium]|nr:beta-propeller domain-containing protein [Deltaproteobacteria bacterium]
MKSTTIRLLTPLLASLFALTTGCADAKSGVNDTGVARDTPSEGEEPRGTRPIKEILESDLYRLVADQLYVYNETAGIYALDLSDPQVPMIRAHQEIFGPAGELYAHDGKLVVVLEQASIGCIAPEGMPASYQGSEIVVLSDRGDALEVESRTCLAGRLTDTRLRGDVLYAVTGESDRDRTFAFSLDLADPREPRLAGQVELPGESREIFLNDQVLYVARATAPENDSGWAPETLVTFIDISRLDGQIRERGSVRLPGSPQGRFHMDAHQQTFRIVTFDESAWSSSLHVIDASRPDHLQVVGTLEGLAEGENLHATRFVGERAYVVTWQQVDPLWVIDLSDPTRPSIMGELEIPGWSDFIFPREGGRLLTVGRGPSMGIAVSLFDVTEPSRPAQLATVEFGDGASQSEAIGDFRGAQILEQGALGEGSLPLIAIPTATETYVEGSGDWACLPALHLVDLNGDQLRVRGSVVAEGAIRRSFAAGGQLLALTDLELRSLDVSDRDQPRTTASVALGNEETARYACEWTDERVWGGMWMGDDMVMACSADATSTSGPGAALALALIFGAIGLLRPRRRR